MKGPFVKHLLDVPRAHAAGIQIVRIDIDFEAALDHPAFSVLAEDERTRARRFFRKEDALRFSAARLALRDALGELLDVPPGSLQFDRDANGRPRLISDAGPNLYSAFDFNVSHSGGHALIALANGRRVGVDVEATDRRNDWRTIAPAVFSSHEHAYVMSLPEHLRRNAFFKVWTAKEALLKAVGTGLSAGMTHFSVIGEGDGVTGIAAAPPQPLPHEQCDVHYSQWGAEFDGSWCPVPADYTACVAWSRESH